MNVKKFSFIVGIVFLSGSLVIAQITTTNLEQVREELNAVHRELAQAIDSGDIARIRSFYSPDFHVRTRTNRVLTLADMETLMSLSERPQLIDGKSSMVIQALKLVGTEAVITVQHNRDATYKLDDGSAQRVVEVVRQQERWTRQSDGWKFSVLEDVEQKKRDVTINGRKADEVLPNYAVPIAANADDQTILNEGYGIVFIYRMNDGAIIKPPIYVNDQKLAQMTGGSFLKIKLAPGKYTLKSEKGDPIDLQVEAGKISLLVLKLETGFPKGRGNLRIDRSVVAAQAYKLSKLLGLNPLGSDNIDDPTKVIGR